MKKITLKYEVFTITYLQPEISGHKIYTAMMLHKYDVDDLHT